MRLTDGVSRYVPGPGEVSLLITMLLLMRESIYLLQQSQHVCVNVYGRCDGDDVEVPTTAIHPSISWHTRTHTRTGHMATSYPLHASTVIWPGASSRP